MTVLIGDVHGKYDQYKRIMAHCTGSIQVGDMGYGFRRLGGFRDGQARINPPHAKMVAGNHRCIRGNHDNPGVCKTQRQCIPDGTIEGDVMFIGGAQSVDREWRIEGYDWWPDEELSQSELDALVAKYVEVRPRVMITHDCPEEIAICMAAVSGRKKLDFVSRTRLAFQRMISAHQPKLWVFGHWHHSFDQVSQGTRWICLNELEARDIDLENA